MNSDLKPSKIDAPVTLITGASAGIGLATAELLASKGHRLLVTARREEKLQELAQRLGSEAIEVFPGDLADPATAPAAVARTIERFGKLDNLVNNGGFGVYAKFESLSDELWRRQLDVNLMGAVRFAREALKVMAPRRTGTIVNVSSVAGFIAFPTGAAYCASKYALEGMSGCLREEVRELGIRVTLICPGSVGSEFFHKSEGHLMGEDRTKDQRWMITPGQIARAIATAIECEPGAFIARMEVRPLGRGLLAMTR